MMALLAAVFCLSTFGWYEAVMIHTLGQLSQQTLEYFFHRLLTTGKPPSRQSKPLITVKAYICTGLDFLRMCASIRSHNEKKMMVQSSHNRHIRRVGQGD